MEISLKFVCGLLRIYELYLIQKTKKTIFSSIVQPSLLNNRGQDDVRVAALHAGATLGISAHQLEASASVGLRPHHHAQQSKSFKGQLISKCLFGIFNSSKKRTKNFCPSRLGQKLKFSSSFFGRIEDTKMSFRN